MDAVKYHFSLYEAVILSGFTKYMLDYLARENILRPSGSEYGVRGRPRLYTYEDLVLLRALSRVCGARGKIRDLKGALAALRDEIGTLAPGQQLDQLVFIDGKELSIRVGKDSGRQLRTGQLTFGFLLDLRVVAAELAKVVSLDKRSGEMRLARSVRTEAEAMRQAAWVRVRANREVAA